MLIGIRDVEVKDSLAMLILLYKFATNGAKLKTKPLTVIYCCGILPILFAHFLSDLLFWCSSSAQHFDTLKHSLVCPLYISSSTRTRTKILWRSKNLEQKKISHSIIAKLTRQFMLNGRNFYFGFAAGEMVHWIQLKVFETLKMTKSIGFVCNYNVIDQQAHGL